MEVEMNKKLIIASLFACLVGLTSIFSHQDHNQLDLIAPGFQQQQFGIPQDYFVLGTDVWLAQIRQVDEHLDHLHAEFEQAENENLNAEQFAYSNALEAYFTALIQDLGVLSNFFEFDHMLAQDDKEEMADRLLTVVTEHQQFLDVGPHYGNLGVLLGHTEQVLERVSNILTVLYGRLEDLLPHEADNEMGADDE
jgi:hypothetical protein